MLFTILLALTGITLSLVAIYYSVIGLTAIFAAAFWPIVIMGSTLEVSKLVAASWLKWRWNVIPGLMKAYLLIAVFVLMLITSMGIFGFLSKAHLEQTVPTGDVAAKVSLIDEKINNEREIIANARTLLSQLDKTVADISSGPGRQIRQRDGSMTQENPAERALAVRRSQTKDRATLTKTIEDAQNRIVQLQEEKAPIASQLRTVEAKVGPITYLAKLIYGDNPDKNILEKAVTWVILILIFVFDPMAVLLILASQMNYQWWKKERDEKLVLETFEKVEPPPISEDAKAPDDVSAKNEPIFEEVKENATTNNNNDNSRSDSERIDTRDDRSDAVLDPAPKDRDIDIEVWNRLVEEAEKEITKEKLNQEVEVEWTVVEQLEDEKLEEPKKKTTYLIKEQNQQITKTKDL